MGSLMLPTSGLIYVDTQTLIYTVEPHPDYSPLLRPLWEAVQRQQLDVVTSELSLMETLVRPLKAGDSALIAKYERFLSQPGFRQETISTAVLREGAKLRATSRLRTPDAIHAATARLLGVALFVTNDDGFRNVVGVPTTILHHLLPS